MLDQLRRVMFRWRLQPERVVADTTYGTVENIRALEEAGIRAYVPLPDFDRPHALLRHAAASPTTPSATSTAARTAQPLRRRDGQVHRARCVVYRRRRGDLQRLPAEGARAPPATHGRSVHRSLRRGVPRPGARLPRDGGLPEGDAQAEGLGGAAVRRGQAVARPAPVPAAGAGAGQHGRAADRGRAEPEALAGGDGLGPAPRPDGEPLRPSVRPPGRASTPSEHRGAARYRSPNLVPGPPHCWL